MEPEIGAARAQDQDPLNRHLALTEGLSHAFCLRSQERGEGIYLVARDRDLPVGRLFLSWRNTEAPRLVDEHPEARELVDLPELCDVYVVPERRSAGIGSHLIRRALAEARRHAAPAATVCVHTDNPRARRLYERLGFTDSGLGVFTTRGTFTDEEGVERPWQNGPQVLLRQPLP